MINASVQLQTLAQKKIRIPTAKVYIMWDGEHWTDETSRLKNVSGYEEMGGGLFEMGISEVDVEFYNEDFHFTLNHPNCNITEDQMVPKRRIKVEIGFNNEHLTRFNGYIESYVPDIKSGTFKVHAFDRAYQLKHIKSGYHWYVNKTPTELIRELGHLAGISDDDMILEDTTHRIGFAYFEDRTIWFLMDQISAAEGGRIFFNQDNKLVFWNRHHISFASNPVFFFRYSDYILNQPYEISDKDIKNRIIVKAEARKVYEEQEVWNVNDESKDEFKRVYAYNNNEDNDLLFNVTLKNPVTDYVRPLEPYTDYIANTAPDGSGTDVTDKIRFINFGTYIKGLFFHIRYEANSGIAYFTKLRVRGTPAKVYSRVNAEVWDNHSISLYGEHEKKIENPYIDSYDFAINLAQTQLNMFANTLSNFSTDVIAIPWLQPGDIVGIQLVPDSNKLENYLITKIKWSWSPRGGATMTLNLAINYAEYNKLSETLVFSEAHQFTTDSGQYVWGPYTGTDKDDLEWNLGSWN